MFRGDVEHGGASYTMENRRFYFKVFPNGATLDEKELESVGASEKKCKYCDKVIKGSVYYHERSKCPVRWNAEQIEKMREDERERADKNRKKKRNKIN